MINAEPDPVSPVAQKYAKWGISIVALWAAILAVLALANLLVLSRVIQQFGYEPESRNQVWLIFVLNVVFGLSFAASAYGLWRKHNWGRLLFLGSIITWSASNIFALFAYTASASLQSQLLNSLRYVVGPVVSVWYLNLHRIKRSFGSHSPVTMSIEEEKDE